MSGDWPTDPMKVLEARDRLQVYGVNAASWEHVYTFLPAQGDTDWAPRLTETLQVLLDVAIVHSDAKAHDLLHRVKELEARIESLEKARDETRP